MKQSEVLQLKQIVELLVAKEVKKQLPSIIAETFQNMMGKPVITEQKRVPSPAILDNVINSSVPEQEEQIDLKTSLREMFSGNGPVTRTHQQSVQQPTSRPMRQLAKDPILNKILNETTSDLRQKEGYGAMAGLDGGFSPSLSMIPGFDPSNVQMASNEPEPSFTRNMPSMPNINTNSGQQMLVEGQESSYAPMESIPTGTSVLDVAMHVPGAVGKALTKNYSQLLKLVDAKRGKV